ncbi:MAG: DUF3563 domain-containing protein [Rhizobiales bacterium]|nr:DUF3563 domain-containing protein [Hyphomicrobiales bacterium]MBA68979.1 DUF3563 domain-containing protein [Hyphomicrobiales bacterium]|tara:strand:+ start:198 stop:356 length:159 start_codon:yes stop_codon:yes gene_type:complete
MFSNLQKFAAKFRAPSQHELEMRYLSEARDLYDLEYRSRQIDNGHFRARRSY